jgi:CheY-like chemotaxis protein
MLLEIFSVWLRSAGCIKLSLARDGEEALQKLREVPFDLVITDVRMPIMDGPTLVRSLNKIDRSLPRIILLSGSAEFDRREMYGLGVGNFLQKPITPDGFIETVRLALAERAELWRTPPETSARQLMQLNFDRFPPLLNKSSIHLGRGGFSAFSPTPLYLGKIALKFKLPGMNRETTGHGQVRWYSRAEQTAGVEFDFLEKPSLDWFLTEIASTNPRSFIPSR